MDTFHIVKVRLIALLTDSKHRVVVLKGQWGTGKTKMWHDVREQLFPASYAGKRPVYVSLFGVKSTSELKLRILQTVFTSDQEAKKLIVGTSAGLLGSALKKFVGYSAEDAALLWVSSFIKDRLIVLDDVERKGKAFEVDELLGFLDEMTESNGTRFLLLLNINKLGDAGLWETLHEKVIDAEISLRPSAGDSFDIAVADDTSPYLPSARQACVTLSLTNIRVINHVVAVIKTVIQSSGNKNCTVWARWVPVTVLLVATHYRAVENAPPISFVRSFDSFMRAFAATVNDENEAPNESEARWQKMLEDLGIADGDEFVTVIHDYLQYGILDLDELRLIFERYNGDSQNDSIFNKLQQLNYSHLWDPSITKTEMEVLARDLLPSVTLMTPGQVSDVIRTLQAVDEEELANEFLETWIAFANGGPTFKDKVLNNRLELEKSKHFHPSIVAKLDALRSELLPKIGILNAVNRVVENRGWSEIELIALNGASAEEYAELIKTLKGDELRTVLVTHLNWVSGLNGKDDFADATAHFLSACRSIYVDPELRRLGEIISRCFRGVGKEDLLH